MVWFLFLGEFLFFVRRVFWSVLKNPQTQRWDTPTILYWSRSRWVEAKRGVPWLSNPNSYPSNHTSGHTLSRRNEPRNKTGQILSIESWLFNIGILLMVYCNPHITGCIIPYIPKTTQVFFIAQTWKGMLSKQTCWLGVVSVVCFKE